MNILNNLDCRVKNFKYDGFGVEMLKGYAKYEIMEFMKWTNDPGIGLFLCSDNQERYIPSCQLSTEYKESIPKQEKLNCFGPFANGSLFGKPCKS